MQLAAAVAVALAAVAFSLLELSPLSSISMAVLSGPSTAPLASTTRDHARQSRCSCTSDQSSEPSSAVVSSEHDRRRLVVTWPVSASVGVARWWIVVLLWRISLWWITVLLSSSTCDETVQSRAVQISAAEGEIRGEGQMTATRFVRPACTVTELGLSHRARACPRAPPTQSIITNSPVLAALTSDTRPFSDRDERDQQRPARALGAIRSVANPVRLRVPSGAVSEGRGSCRCDEVRIRTSQFRVARKRGGWNAGVIECVCVWWRRDGDRRRDSGFSPFFLCCFFLSNWSAPNAGSRRNGINKSHI